MQYIDCFGLIKGGYMKLTSASDSLNIRATPAGAVIGELHRGDLFESTAATTDQVWVPGTVLSGIQAGRDGHVRRKWLQQYFESPPQLSNLDRTKAAKILAARTAEFDHVHYGLGTKAKSWDELKERKSVDCSGWIYLLGMEIMTAYDIGLEFRQLRTFSDEQITNVGKATGVIISGKWLVSDVFQAGCMVGLDFGEYSWDRNRPLDIDHIVMVGEDQSGKFITQSSSIGSGVNRVPFDKWMRSTQNLRNAGKVHLVDLLALAA